jgi:hypothetical protein
MAIGESRAHQAIEHANKDASLGSVAEDSPNSKKIPIARAEQVRHFPTPTGKADVRLRQRPDGTGDFGRSGAATVEVSQFRETSAHLVVSSPADDDPMASSAVQVRMASSPPPSSASNVTRSIPAIVGHLRR